MNFTSKLVTAVSGEAKSEADAASPHLSRKAKSELADVTKALKRKLSEKVSLVFSSACVCLEREKKACGTCKC